MKYRNLLFTLLGVLVSGTLLAQVDSIENKITNNFYERGRVAFEENDHINAIKFLFAYKMQHMKDLENDPEFLAKLDSALDQSEKTLREALQNSDFRQHLKAQAPFSQEYVAMDPNNTVNTRQIDDGLEAEQKLLETQIELITLELELEKLRLEAEMHRENKGTPDN